MLMAMSLVLSGREGPVEDGHGFMPGAREGTGGGDEAFLRDAGGADGGDGARGVVAMGNVIVDGDDGFGGGGGRAELGFVMAGGGAPAKHGAAVETRDAVFAGCAVFAGYAG